MDTTTLATVIGEIEGEVARKTVNEKALAEFRVKGLALRISAWEGRAQATPDAGAVVVSGYFRTRTYIHNGEDRQTTEIIATNIQPLDVAPSATVDNDLPF